MAEDVSTYIGDRMRERSVDALAHQLEIERTSERRAYGRELAISALFLGLGFGVATVIMDTSSNPKKEKRRGR